MGGGKHDSDEEFEFEFNFELVRNILLIIVILAIIAGVVLGTYKLVSKMKNAKTEPVSGAEVETGKQAEFPVLGTLKIDKIGIQQSIFDSVKEKALQQGVIKLYGDTLNQER